MGTLIGSIFPNDFARRYSGTGQADYIRNPANQYDTVGAMSFWFSVPVLLSSNGYIPMICFSHNGTPSGAYGKKITFSIRRNSGYGDTNNHFSWELSINGTASTFRVPSLSILASTWYHVLVCSDGSIYINSVLVTSYLVSSFSSAWFIDIAGLGTDHDLCFGGILNNAGSLAVAGRCDLNEVIYLTSVPTSTEVGLLYNGGTPPDPGLLPGTLQSKIIVYRDFENTLIPVIGSGTLTALGPPTYIAFP